MTIPSYASKLNERLSNLEDCAERAPDNTYNRAKDAVGAISESINVIRSIFRRQGFRALNDDRQRTVEAMLYGYLLESNPDEGGLITGEGFGEATNTQAAQRVIAQATRDRDALAKLGFR